jgi:hypothetical protein
MKRFFSVSLLSSFIIILLLQFGITSCKKEVIKYDTVIITKHDTTITVHKDTIEVPSIDTTFIMDVNNWNAYNFQDTTNKGLVAPGSTTYFNTNEGIEFVAQAPRYGLRLQTKGEVGIVNKTIYFKWKGNGMGQFAQFVLQLKYDPFTGDGIPPIQDVDFPDFTVNNSFNGSTLVQNDVWYYTRIYPVAGTDNYHVVTSTGNYDNKGGVAFVDKVVTVYTKHGYLSIRIGDTFASNTYCILGECKIASN